MLQHLAGGHHLMHGSGILYRHGQAADVLNDRIVRRILDDRGQRRHALADTVGYHVRDQRLLWIDLSGNIRIHHLAIDLRLYAVCSLLHLDNLL